MALKRWIASIFPFLFSIFGVVRAQELIPQEQLEPALGWVSLVLGKNIATFDGFILVILLTIFMTIVLYQAIKRSGVFQSDTGVSNSVEAVIAVIIAILVMRFMPIEYFVILLVGFLILAALLTFYTLFKMVTGTLGESGFSQAVFVLVTGFGIFATGTLMTNFRTTLSASGFRIPVEVADFGNIFMAIGIFIILLGSLGLIGRFYTSSKGLIGGLRKETVLTSTLRRGGGKAKGGKKLIRTEEKVTARVETGIRRDLANEILEAKKFKKLGMLAESKLAQAAANIDKTLDRIEREKYQLEKRSENASERDQRAIANTITRLTMMQQNLAKKKQQIDNKLVRRKAKGSIHSEAQAREYAEILPQGYGARTRPKKANAKTRTRRKTPRRTVTKHRR